MHLSVGGFGERDGGGEPLSLRSWQTFPEHLLGRYEGVVTESLLNTQPQAGHLRSSVSVYTGSGWPVPSISPQGVILQRKELNQGRQTQKVACRGVRASGHTLEWPVLTGTDSLGAQHPETLLAKGAEARRGQGVAQGHQCASGAAREPSCQGFNQEANRPCQQT